VRILTQQPSKLVKRVDVPRKINDCQRFTDTKWLVLDSEGAVSVVGWACWREGTVGTETGYEQKHTEGKNGVWKESREWRAKM